MVLGELRVGEDGTRQSSVRLEVGILAWAGSLEKGISGVWGHAFVEFSGNLGLPRKRDIERTLSPMGAENVVVGADKFCVQLYGGSKNGYR